MGVGFQIPIKNLVSILTSTAVKTVISELVELLVSRLVSCVEPSLSASLDTLVSHLPRGFMNNELDSKNSGVRNQDVGAQGLRPVRSQEYG